MVGSPESGTMRGLTPVVVCADDYGLNPAVGAAIRDLISAGRLSATSCMTTSRHWAAEGALLKPLRGRAAVGLHFTLTELAPLSELPELAPDGRLPPLGTLLRKALYRRLQSGGIRRELEAQFDSFERVMDTPPDYLDGHHHVHQLPVVRDVVLEVAAKRLMPGRCYLRFCDEPMAEILSRGVAVPRAALISLLARKFAAQARRVGFLGNRGFRGVRNFTADEDAAALYSAFLRQPQAGMMIMCHPGGSAEGEEDSIAACRVGEYRFLRSDAFTMLLAARRIAIVPPGRMAE